MALVVSQLLRQPSHLAMMGSNAAATYKPATEIITREILRELTGAPLASDSPDPDNAPQNETDGRRKEAE